MKKITEKFWLWVMLAFGAGILCLLLLRSEQPEQSGSVISHKPTQGVTQATPPSSPTTQEETAPSTLQTETSHASVEDVLAQQGLSILEIGSYTGAYVEDGSDEIVSGVAMLVLENNSGETIQYAEIQLHGGEEMLTFTFSTFPSGEALVILEKDRKSYQEGANYEPELSALALFDSDPSLQEDQLEIQTLDGAINITNISGADITEDIVIYYKNCSQDLLYGGITYRIQIPGGLKNDEIRQIMAKHFTLTSRIMFVTIG